MKASLTNTLYIKSDITFSIFVQRKVGCVRRVMWNLHCSMKPVTLPCLPKLLITALPLQQPPTHPTFPHIQRLVGLLTWLQNSLYSKQGFCWSSSDQQWQAGVCQLRLPSQQAGTAKPHSAGHSQEHPGENKAQGSLPSADGADADSGGNSWRVNWSVRSQSQDHH